MTPLPELSDQLVAEAAARRQAEEKAKKDKPKDDWEWNPAFWTEPVQWNNNNIAGIMYSIALLPQK